MKRIVEKTKMEKEEELEYSINIFQLVYH